MRPRLFRFHYTTFDKRDGKELHYCQDYSVAKRYPTAEELDRIKSVLHKRHSAEYRIDILGWSEMGR